MKKIIYFILTFSIMISLCPDTFAANQASAPISTKDGFLDVEIEDLPYNPDYFKVKAGDIYSGGIALEPSSEDKTVPAASEEAVRTSAGILMTAWYVR